VLARKLGLSPPHAGCEAGSAAFRGVFHTTLFLLLVALGLLLVALGCDAPGTSAPERSPEPPRAGPFRTARPAEAGAETATPEPPEPPAGATSNAEPAAPPETEAAPSLDPDDEKRIDAAVRGAIDRREIPGAVVLLVAKDRVVLHRAYGLRATTPAPLPMAKDTVFDLASLTKPIATATSIAWLVERRKLRFTDAASRYVPELAANGKGAITIEQLLLHTSGLPADNALAAYSGDRAAALGRVFAVAPEAAPGEKFRYSDLGFLVLGEIVARVASASLDTFTHDHLFAPLAMRSTLFTPPAGMAARCAPTEKLGDVILLGKVHDPRARALGGVAGHAGLFSTAPDLGRFARMLLDGGSLAGARVLAEATVRSLFEPRAIPGGKRAYFGAVTGEAVSHTGFTGTSLWLVPRRKIAVVILSNRVHPDGKGSADRLRREAIDACVAAAAKVKDVAPMQTGIDALEAGGFAELRGHKVALLTHAAGRTRGGRSTIDALKSAPGVTLVALLAPEHGLRSTQEGAVRDAKDARTGLPIHSLYGVEKRPTKAMLEGADTLVIDLQDAGVRFYTYETTTGYALEAAAQLGVRVVLLDRPNPLGGVTVAGPIRDEASASFVAYHPVPIQHGMTLGELARMYRSERKLAVDLTVVPMKGWKRAERFADTGLVWTPPSPNLRSPTAALLYPGVGLLELTNLSVGRGTPRPFEQLGAPWIEGAALAKALREAALPGVAIEEATFTPTASTFAGEKCHGVAIGVTDPASIDAVRLGLTIAVTLRRLHPQAWQSRGLLTLLGHARAYDAIAAGQPMDQVLATFAKETATFTERRRPFLLY
jgi:uncharacterized protein YbbC (DUF1343 family)/CubicO group peptidase (beta-lactamase class C family)